MRFCHDGIHRKAQYHVAGVIGVPGAPVRVSRPMRMEVGRKRKHCQDWGWARGLSRKPQSTGHQRHVLPRSLIQHPPLLCLYKEAKAFREQAVRSPGREGLLVFLWQLLLCISLDVVSCSLCSPNTAGILKCCHVKCHRVLCRRRTWKTEITKACVGC